VVFGIYNFEPLYYLFLFIFGAIVHVKLFICSSYFVSKENQN